MASILVFIIFVFVVINLVRAAAKQKRPEPFRMVPHSDERAWRDTADLLGLEFVPASETMPLMAIRGNYSGFYLEIFQLEPEAGSEVFCVIQSEYKSIPGFFISNFTGTDRYKAAKPAENLFPGLFPEETRVSASDTLTVPGFLARKRMNILKNCFGISKTVEITENSFMLSEMNLQTAEKIVQFVNRTLTSAVAFMDEDTALEHNKTDAELFPDDRKTVPVRRKTTVIGINPEDTRPAYQFVEKKTEAVKPVEPVKTVEVMKPVEPVAEEVPVQETVPDGFETENVEQHLFFEPFPGQKEKDWFAQHTGQPVEWKAVLRSVYPYGSDFVFGKGPGAKATFLLPEFTVKNGTRVQIKVTAALSESALSELKNRTGEHFVVSGNLLSFEPYAKEIFLKNASYSPINEEI